MRRAKIKLDEDQHKRLLNILTNIFLGEGPSQQRITLDGTTAFIF